MIEPHTDLLYYLASPYTHSLAKIRQERARLAAKAAVGLAERGYYVYAPVPHGHALAKHLDLDYHYWIEHGLRMIASLDAVIVLLIPGWRQSTGIRLEVERARLLAKPVFWLDRQGNFTPKPKE